jgi:hypothetical protein
MTLDHRTKNFIRSDLPFYFSQPFADAVHVPKQFLPLGGQRFPSARADRRPEFPDK